jgi:hypothetical protein
LRAYNARLEKAGKPLVASKTRHPAPSPAKGPAHTRRDSYLTFDPSLSGRARSLHRRGACSPRSPDAWLAFESQVSAHGGPRYARARLPGGRWNGRLVWRSSPWKHRRKWNGRRFTGVGRTVRARPTVRPRIGVGSCHLHPSRRLVPRHLLRSVRRRQLVAARRHSRQRLRLRGLERRLQRSRRVLVDDDGG